MNARDRWEFADLSMLTSKFLGAVLPLLILGYIFGLFVAAALHGWDINPLIILLNGVGLLLAYLECAARL
jgi:hypothetical protein